MRSITKIDDFLSKLRGALLEGSWQIGDKLPPEEYFMTTFQVSRTLLREAMRQLIAEGIITRRHGSGTYLHSRPRKRLEVYAWLDNIISMGANWYRWQIKELKRRCSEQDYDLEVLVSYGETPDERIASFRRHLSCPLNPGIVGAVVLFYNSEMESLLKQRGGHYVTVTTVCQGDCQDSAVILDYGKMGEMMVAEIARCHAKHPCLVFIDDKSESVNSTNYQEQRDLYDLVMPAKENQLLIPSYEEVEAVFGEWLLEKGDGCDLLVFADDEVTKMAFGVIARQGKAYPGMRCITHGNIGLLNMSKPDIGEIKMIGFGLEQVSDAVWHLVNDCNTGSTVRILPKRIEMPK